ncbi:MAG: glycosyltransferase family 4 protein [Candidatus Poribacteria bacterium]
MKEKLDILFVSATIPYPAIDGGRIRVLNLLQNLSKYNNITFLTYNSSDEDERNIKYLRDIGINVLDVKFNYNKILFNIPSILKQTFKGKPFTIAKYYSKEMVSKINELLEKNLYDVIHFEMFHTGQHITELSNVVYVEICLGLQNIDSLIWKRLADTERNPIKKLILRWQYNNFLNLERMLSPLFDCCICVSAEDMERLISINPFVRICIAPNGVDTDYFMPMDIKENEHQIVFVGSMNWQPNEDAVLYFCDKIFPLIKGKIPQIRFYIVGSNPTERVTKLRNIDGVIVTGLVDDVRDYISQSAVFVVPLRIGGGTRLKILQALAMKKAVVSTSIGCEGLGLIHNEHLLISDDPKEFAESVMLLLNDKDLRYRLGENGRKLVEDKYDWKAISMKLNTIYRNYLRRDNEKRFDV